MKTDLQHIRDVIETLPDPTDRWTARVKFQENSVMLAVLSVAMDFYVADWFDAMSERLEAEKARIRKEMEDGNIGP